MNLVTSTEEELMVSEKVKLISCSVILTLNSTSVGPVVSSINCDTFKASVIGINTASFRA